MNAIPSESRTPRTRCPGQASFRDVAITTGPLVLHVRVRGYGRERGEPVRLEDGRFGGRRCAKRASRPGPVARLNAQGRVGLHSRHIALHLGLHRLLSAPASVALTADSLLLTSCCQSGHEAVGSTRPSAARTKAQPISCRLPRIKASDAKLVPNGFDATAPGRGLSRGKGVLAA